MMELIERFVRAVEKIAEALSNPPVTHQIGNEFDESKLPGVIGKILEDVLLHRPDGSNPGLIAEEMIYRAPPVPHEDPIAVTPTVILSLGLDADGMPYDSRIHASTQTKMKNGTWKLARGVDKDLVAQARAEHHLAGYGVQSITSFVPSAPDAAPAPTAPAEPPAPDAAPAPAEPPAPPATTEAPMQLTFPAFMKLVNDVGYTKEDLLPKLQEMGIASVPQLAQNLDKMTLLAQQLGLI